MRILFLLTLLLPTRLFAQDAAIDGEKQAWVRVPKEIVFQNVSQWEDNRWQQV